MATSAGSDKKFYLSITTPLPDERFEVISVSGQEYLSRPFFFVVELGSDDPNIDLSALLGNDVTVSIVSGDGMPQLRNGIVAGITSRLGVDGQIVYIAEIVPWLWMLTQTTDNRIFQNQSVPEIIELVFSDFGFTDDARFDLRGSYQPREYCVQYGESYFDFVSRLMEEEGIFYFFEHKDGQHILVLGDDPGVHITCPGLSEPLHFKKFDAAWVEEDAIISFSTERRIVPTEYRLGDYNFKIPSNDLGVSVDGNAKGAKHFQYDYPGGYVTRSEGERLVKMRIEAAELSMRTMQGTSSCRDLIAGFRFELIEHEREELNDEYVVQSFSFYASQEQYENSFVVFPSSVPFRPLKTTPRPLLNGYQIATVVGKSGEEIYTDEFGRVKVQFPWDTRGKRDENSSCWMRVAQMWAGKGWGTMAIPRMGAEVIISFLDGDPDRPLIVGTVYNGEQTVPYSLPDDKTKTTIKTDSSKGGQGFNELRFEDLKGKEEVFLQAEKDLTITVKNDKNQSVGHDESLSVKNNRTVSVDGTFTETIKKDTTITITEGNLSETVVKGSSTQEVMKAVTETFHDTMTTNVTKDIVTTSGKTISITAADKLTITVGGSSLTMEKNGTIKLIGKLITISGSDKVEATSTKEVKLGVASQTVTANTSKVEVSGAGIASSAVGIHEITGAIVKIN